MTYHFVALRKVTFWIGARRRGMPLPSWKWLCDYSTLSYTNWDLTSTGTGNFAFMKVGNGFKWLKNNGGITMNQLALCEVPNNLSDRCAEHCRQQFLT